MNKQNDAIALAVPGLHITIHTDGAAHGNPGPGGWGAVLCRMDGESELKRLKRGGAVPHQTTNIRMEMTAVVKGLEVIKAGEPSPIIVRSDLIMIVDGITKWLPGWIKRGWRTSQNKPVENIDLWQRIVAACDGKTVHWLWVRGHAGDERNELAHAIAQRKMRAAISMMFGEAA